MTFFNKKVVRCHYVRCQAKRRVPLDQTEPPDGWAWFGREAFVYCPEHLEEGEDSLWRKCDYHLEGCPNKELHEDLKWEVGPDGLNRTPDGWINNNGAFGLTTCPDHADKRQRR